VPNEPRAHREYDRALALGDALAMTLFVAKGFRAEDFANIHPGGKIGKRLYARRHVMHGGDQRPPVVVGGTAMPRRMTEMSGARAWGMTCCPSSRAIGSLGIITTGDLRRHMIAAQQGWRRVDSGSGNAFRG
jgi:arabinose-5-phosphate isomerase